MTTPESTPTSEPAARQTKLTPMAEIRTAFDNYVRPEVADMAAKSSNELAAMRTDLALDRNLMAADRTLMAWVRTSLSLFSFGFTIYKVLEGFQAKAADLPPDATPRNIGLFLSAMGTIAMVMGTIEYWQSLSALRHLEKFRLVRAPLVMAVFMSVMGVFLFFSITLKLF